MEIIQDRFLEETKEKLNSLGIKAILFDFDDTLIYTAELFTKYITEFVAKVSEETGLDLKEVDTFLRKISDEEYEKMGVNPARWSEVVKRMTQEDNRYGDSTEKNLEILMKIYTDEPRIRSGARGILHIIKNLGIKVGLVTHANKDWTERKLASAGMAEDFDTIVIADENKHKGVEDWMEAMINLEVLPEECLVVGDSLGGDVIPTAKIGARTMWLHNGSQWSKYRTGTVPENTLHLDEINQLLSALGELR